VDTATFVGRYLAARGIRYAFGHPGSDVMDLIESMEQAGITFVLTHHENTGAFMASTMGQLTGIAGVALATKGPGITNIASGVGAAYLDRAPLLCFTSHVDEQTARRYVHQHLAVVDFFRPISKLSAELTAANVAELLPRAYSTATASLPGSVYLPTAYNQQRRPIGVSDADAELLIAANSPRETLPTPDTRAGCDVLRGARRLAAVVGPGVNHLPLHGELIAAIEALQAPACVTPEAVGQIPADHPLYMGMYAWYDDSIRRTLREADVVLTVGLDGCDMLTTFDGEATIVSLAAAGASDPTFPNPAIALNGDLRGMLAEVARYGVAPRDWGADHAGETRTEVERDLLVSTEHSDADGIPPQSVFTVMREALPRDAIFTCDVGAHKSLAAQAWKSYAPRTFSMSNGLSAMGYGLASAMGAKLACPTQPVISVIGDGGFLMYAGELATWARLNLPLTLVVMADYSLTQVKRRQERRGYSVASTSFQRVDYCAVARAYGIDAVRAETTAELQRAAEKARAANRPFLIEAALDVEEYRRIPGTP
jgi:acetolactate synthase-1/2/3 large subunit